jgi:hypothetical protein
VISLRRARVADAIAIGAVHVAAWRSTYPGILPDTFLAKMSVSRQAAFYDAAIRGGTGVTDAPGTRRLPANAWRKVKSRHCMFWTTGGNVGSAGG